ncbi:smc6 [Candida pseudojiufengensis]|uniref:smc6 n=1 Tax=Candida pseudojiufengensis TaxID=497109 RepID=UPI00222498ED|nr:smc6 [Candida pseudojiufengensis]KAI5960771.1 smc6 [Candida pseudojiufengensis]
MATTLKRSREDDSFNSNNSNSYTCPSQQITSSMMRPSKRRARMTQLNEDEDEEGEDGLESGTGDDEDEDDEEDDDSGTEEVVGEEFEAPAQAGIIEKLTLKNFMCHEFFELTLGPQINFIIGRNGSGKSAILTGISVGLGAKATDTNRGSSIRQLIKDGSSTSRISITIKNEGPMAYKPEEYGKKIIIERKLVRVGLNTYSIKSEQGDTISQKKAVLDDILYKFNITVDNPLAFLSQDKAREFLSTATAKTKFEYFMAGAYINDIHDNLDSTARNIRDIESRIDQSKVYLSDCETNYKKIKKIYEAHKKNDHLRNKMDMLTGKVHWFNVEAYEKRLKTLKGRILESENKIQEAKAQIEFVDEEMRAKDSEKSKLIDSVSQIANEHDIKAQEHENAGRQRTEMKAQLKIQGEEIKKNKNEIKKLQEDIKYTEKKLKSERKKIEEEQGGSKDDMREELKQVIEKISECENKLRDVNETIRNMDRRPNVELEELTNSKRQIGETIQELKQRQVELEREQSSKYTPWGAHRMQTVIDAINKTSWTAKPIGPLGSYILVKKQYDEWKRLMDSTLKKHLDAFITVNDRDRTKLNGILKSNGFYCNIIVRRTEKFHYESGRARAATSILDMIEINDETVLYALIDLASIEKTVIANSIEEAKRLCQESNVYNALVQFSESSGQRIWDNHGNHVQDPVYYSGKMPKFGVSNREELVNDLKQEIRREIQKLNEIEKKISESKKSFENEKVEVVRERRELSQELSRLKNIRASLEDKIDKEIDQSVALRYESKIEESKSQIERLESFSESLEEDMDSKMDKYNEVKNNLKVLEREANEVKERKEVAQAELDKLKEYIRLLGDKKKESSYSETQYLTEIENDKRLIASGESKLQAQITKAREFCNRTDVEITEDDTQLTIEAEYKEIQTQMEEAERQLGTSLEVVISDLRLAQSKRDNARDNQEHLEAVHARLEEEINMRVAFLSTTISHAVNLARRSFEVAMELRGFKGSLNMNFGERSLELFVKTKKDDKTRTVESLSGGEKSYTQIALLLSIWQTMNSKIRGLDEFDVYMDSINRSISIKLLLTELARYPKSQSIFITPQDIAVVGDLEGSNVRIHKMSDPRRDN